MNSKEFFSFMLLYCSMQHIERTWFIMIYTIIIILLFFSFNVRYLLYRRKSRWCNIIKIYISCYICWICYQRKKLNLLLIFVVINFTWCWRCDLLLIIERILISYCLLLYGVEIYSKFFYLFIFPGTVGNRKVLRWWK